MVWSKLWSWIQLKNKVTLRKKTEKLKGEKKTKSGKSHIYKWHSQVVCTCLMLYLSIYLQCSADSAAYYISYFYSLFTCRVWFYPESRLLNKKFSLKKDKDHQLVKGNMGLEENLETKRNIWINPTGLGLALLGYIFIALSRDTLLAHICRLWSDGHMAINGH